MNQLNGLTQYIPEASQDFEKMLGDFLNAHDNSPYKPRIFWTGGVMHPKPAIGSSAIGPVSFLNNQLWVGRVADVFRKVKGGWQVVFQAERPAFESERNAYKEAIRKSNPRTVIPIEPASSSQEHQHGRSA